MTNEEIERMKKKARDAALLMMMNPVLAVPTLLAPHTGPIAGEAARTAFRTAGGMMTEFLGGMVDPEGDLPGPTSKIVGWTLFLGGVAGAVWFFAPVVQRKASAYRHGAPYAP